MAINRAGSIARLFARLFPRPVPPESGSAAEAAPADPTSPVPRDHDENPSPASAAEPTHSDALALDGAMEAPEHGAPGPAAPQNDSAAAAGTGPSPFLAPTARGQSVITVLSLVEHAGATTLAAALGRRSEGTGWRIRTAGPGLARASFAGMLGDTDALVLVSPTDPGITAELGQRLRWLEANDRPGMAARTVFVINLGAGDAAKLQLPADLDRPVILLPHDPALGVPATETRVPRRAARAAIDQLVHEISTILQEH